MKTSPVRAAVAVLAAFTPVLMTACAKPLAVRHLTEGALRAEYDVVDERREVVLQFVRPRGDSRAHLLIGSFRRVNITERWLEDDIEETLYSPYTPRIEFIEPFVAAIMTVTVIGFFAIPGICGYSSAEASSTASQYGKGWKSPSGFLQYMRLWAAGFNPFDNCFPADPGLYVEADVLASKSAGMIRYERRLPWPDRSFRIAIGGQELGSTTGPSGMRWINVPNTSRGLRVTFEAPDCGPKRVIDVDADGDLATVICE